MASSDTTSAERNEQLLSCVSTRFCLAIFEGRSYSWDGDRWGLAGALPSTAQWIQGLSCGSPDMCLAISSSETPSGGEDAHFAGLALFWSPTKHWSTPQVIYGYSGITATGGYFLPNSVSCISSRLVPGDRERHVHLVRSAMVVCARYRVRDRRQRPHLLHLTFFLHGHR